jgi:thiol-disulfide isomerase/thioredoxin
VVVAVAVIIAVFIVLGHQASPSGSSYPVTAADPTVVKQVTSVDPAVLAQVGTGSGKVQTKPTKLNGSSVLTGPTGKPEVFYYGAEYCPFCAAERWPLIVALSRFGTFSNLSQTTSSSTDVYANTPTFSFYHSSYSSQYIDFVPLEVESYQGVTLQTPTSAQQQIINQYNPNQSFPFISFANQYTINGASYDPQVLNNLDWQAIASALSNPQSPVAQSILGTANYMTAAICQATNQQPASVCQAAPIPAVQQSLSASTGSAGLTGNYLASLVAEAPATGRRER